MTKLPNKQRGRPSLPESVLLEKIHNAAISLLLEKGHEVFSMDELAITAGVAKKTIYRFYTNKHAVLDKIFTLWTDQQIHPKLDSVSTRAEALNTLETFFVELSAEILNPLSIGIFKYLQSNHPGKSQLLAYYQQHGIGQVEMRLNHWFETLKENHLLNPQCPEQPAQYLQSLILAPLLRDIALGLLPPVPAYDIRPKVSQDLSFLAPILFR